MLEVLVAQSVFNQCFQNDTLLTSMDFSNLTTVGALAFQAAFNKSIPLQDLYFPKLTSIYNNSFTNIFGTSPSITRNIHFAAANQSTIQSLSGYSNKFCADTTSYPINFVFDL